MDAPDTFIAELVSPTNRSDVNVLEACVVFVNNELRDPAVWRTILAAWTDLHPPVASSRARP